MGEGEVSESEGMKGGGVKLNGLKIGCLEK